MNTHMKGIDEYFNMGGKITSHLGFALATVGFATDMYKIGSPTLFYSRVFSRTIRS